MCRGAHCGPFHGDTHLDSLFLRNNEAVTSRHMHEGTRLAWQAPPHAGTEGHTEGRGTYRQIKTGAGFKLKNKNGPFSSVSTATIARVGSFSAFFEIYKISIPSHLSRLNFFFSKFSHFFLT